MPRKYTPAEAEAAFWSKVDRSGGPAACTEWTATRNPDGYGMVQWRGRMRGAHVVAWELAHGPVPDGMQVLHDCPDGDNRACVNVAHLWLGTQGENIADMMAKGRHVAPPRPHPGRMAHGEAHYRAKTTEPAVIEIRRRHAAGETRADLARAFEVNWSTISRIVCREAWKHVAQ